MEWEEVPEEEVKFLKYASRHADNVSIYSEILEAVKAGKTIRLKLEDGVSPKAMSQRLYTAAKAADLQITVRTLAGKEAVTVQLDKSPAPTVPALPHHRPSLLHRKVRNSAPGARAHDIGTGANSRNSP